MIKSLTPENDMQELWELNGRVSAVLTYITGIEEYSLKKSLIIAMLGGRTDTLLVPTDTESEDEGGQAYDC